MVVCPFPLPFPSHRQDLGPGKAAFAQPLPAALVGTPGAARDLAAVVRALRPSTLIGAATVGGAFTLQVLEALAQVCGASEGVARGCQPAICERVLCC